MLGTLLNAFRWFNISIQKYLKRSAFNPTHFCAGATQDYTVSDGTYTVLNGETLADSMHANNPSLSFKNLTIPEQYQIVPTFTYVSKYHTEEILHKPKNDYMWDPWIEEVKVFDGSWLAPGPYSPLVIRCSDTLRVDGSISANGFGENGDLHGSTVPVYSQIKNIYVDQPGYSVTSPVLNKLVSYATNCPFLNFDTFLYGTGGGTGNIGYGISSGAKHDGIAGGGSGGFIVLYFKHLLAEMPDGKTLEYGIHENFPVTRIHANGVGGDCGSTTTKGGGNIIISANTIILGVNGYISADGTLPDGVTQTGTNYAVLNSVPQLGYNQEGWYWNGTDAYVHGTPTSREYFYNTGVEIDTCTKSLNDAGTNYLCGGAGVVIGIKERA